MRLSTRWLALLLFLGAGWLPLYGQESRPTSQPTSRPGITRVRLFDGTAWFQSPEQERRPAYLSGVTVRVSVEGGEPIEALTDASGGVDLDLAKVPTGRTLQLMASTGSAAYVAYPWRSGTPPAETMPLYRVTRSAENLELAVLRIVTERPASVAGGGDGDLIVHVEQVVSFSDRKYEVFLPDGMEDGRPSALFPVPRGADIANLSIDGEESTVADVVDEPGWGYGVRFSSPVFPQARWKGSYELRVARGESVDFGLGTTFFPSTLHLAVQEDRFAYAPADGKFQLQDLGVERPEGSDIRCRFWQSDQLSGGSTQQVPVVYEERTPAPAGLDKLRLIVNTRLFDGTVWFDEQARAASSPEGGHGDIVDKTRMASMDLQARVMGLNGEVETVTVRTDEKGELHADLGERYQESSFTLTAIRNGEPYASAPIVVSAVPNMILLYRVGNDPAKLSQTVFRVVSELLAEGDTPAAVKVRQIMQVSNGANEIYPAAEGNYFFPVPPGAVVDELSIDGEAVASLTAVDHPHWGHGVPLAITVEAQGRGRQIMGTFRILAQEGTTMDLGVNFPGPIGEFTLGLEKPRFQYLTEEASGVPLQAAGEQNIMNRVCLIFTGRVPAGTKVVAPVNYGKPPVKSRTILITALILVVVLGAIGLGMLLSRMRPAGSGSMVSQLAELDGRLARGEITPEVYQSEQQRLAGAVVSSSTTSDAAGAAAGAEAAAGGVDPALRARLLDLSAERSRVPEQLQSDFDELSAAVRELLSKEK